MDAELAAARARDAVQRLSEIALASGDTVVVTWDPTDGRSLPATLTIDGAAWAAASRGEREAVVRAFFRTTSCRLRGPTARYVRPS